MNIINLILGILITILSILYFLYTIRKAKKDKDYDAMTYSFDVNILLGTLVFILLGLVLIYRELKYLL